MTSYILEERRKTEIKLGCDVLVAGGGIAGIAAAIAAARSGARVILLEREYALGGLATLGLITIYLPLCDGKGTQLVYGIGEELLRLSIKHGAERNYPKAWLEDGTPEERILNRFATQFNPILLALEVEQLLLDLGVQILYGTLACGVQVADGRIEAVIVENKSGRSAVTAKTVIDCTGDSDLCRLAGAETVLYSPGNALASWYYYFSQDGVKLKMFGLADVVPGERSTQNDVELIADGTRYTGIDGVELAAMVAQGHRRMFEDIMKGRRGDGTLVPVSMSNIPLLRMTRRLAGEYTLDDAEAHTAFGDSVGLTGDWRKRGPAYEIPFRTLYSRKVKNLLVAGRNISVSEGMWDITRVIPACAVTGEAAGTAAALTDDVPNLDVTLLQRRLKSAGARIHLEEVSLSARRSEV